MIDKTQPIHTVHFGLELEEPNQENYIGGIDPVDAHRLGSARDEFQKAFQHYQEATQGTKLVKWKRFEDEEALAGNIIDGQVCRLKNSDELWYYDGDMWYRKDGVHECVITEGSEWTDAKEYDRLKSIKEYHSKLFDGWEINFQGEGRVKFINAELKAKIVISKDEIYLNAFTSLFEVRMPPEHWTIEFTEALFKTLKVCTQKD